MRLEVAAVSQLLAAPGAESRGCSAVCSTSGMAATQHPYPIWPGPCPCLSWVEPARDTLYPAHEMDQPLRAVRHGLWAPELFSQEPLGTLPKTS